MVKKCGFLIAIYTNENNEKFVLMQLRYDGKLGFIGGEIEEGEDVVDGIVREVKEETSYDKVNISKMNKFKVLNLEEKEIYTYTYSMSKDEVEEIMKCQLKAEHFIEESFGFVIVPITMYEKYGFIENFLNNNFSGTAKEEFKNLI